MFRYSLRELALLMAVVAVVLAWWIENRRAAVLHRERDAVVERLQIANRIIDCERRRPVPIHQIFLENELLRENLAIALDLLRIERQRTPQPVNLAK